MNKQSGISGEGAIAQRIRAGSLASSGAFESEALDQAASLCARVQAEDIETVRLCFTDQHGILRGKTVVADALPSAFESGIGMPSTLLLKDTSHRTAFPVWSDNADGNPLHGANDVLMVPMPQTFTALPWAPHSVLMLCDVVHRSGERIAFSSHQVLSAAVEKLGKADLAARMGLEVEFQVFEVVDPALDHADTTMPPSPPKTRAFNQGFQYLTETRYDAAEDLLDLLRRNAQAMGLPVRSVEIEMGPSQFEFTFDANTPLRIAEMAVLFRTMVKEVCARKGLHASFMAKPGVPNAPANGWHVHQSIMDMETGRNLFMPGPDGTLSAQANKWIAGLLEHASASCLLTTPTVNGYKRFSEHQLAPNRLCWGEDNRGAMIRALMYPADTASRIENRVADSAANPYFALAAQIFSGLNGLENKLTAPPPTESPYDDTCAQLPASLFEAIDAFEASNLYRDALGEGFVDWLATIKRAEWQRYLSTISEWEQAEYFSLF